MKNLVGIVVIDWVDRWGFRGILHQQLEEDKVVGYLENTLVVDKGDM